VTLLFLLVLVAAAVAGYFYWRNLPSQLFQEAGAVRLAGNLPEAEKLYRKLIDRIGASPDPERRAPSALVALGDIMVATGRRGEAFEFFKKARAAKAKLSTTALDLLAETYAQNNDTGDAAFQEYLGVLDRRGQAQASDWVYEALRNACKIGESTPQTDCQGLISRNRQVLEREPDLEWAHYFLGLGLLLAGNFQQAAGPFETALRLNPNRTLTCYWLAVCRLQQSPPEVEAAITMADRFLSEPPANDRTRKRQARIAAEIGKRLMEDLSAPDRSIHYWKTALNRDPGNAAHCFSLGRAHLLAGAGDAGLAAVEEAVRLGPGEKEYVFFLALEYERRGRPSEALDGYRKVVALDAGHVEAHARLSALYLAASEFSNAEGHGRAALDRDPARLDCRGLLARAVHAQGRFAEVVAEVETWPEAARAASWDAPTCLAIGRSFAHVDRFENAVRWYQRHEQDPHTSYYLACAEAHLGRLDAAVGRFTWIIGQGGALAVQSRIERGHVRLRAGAWADAAADYLAVLEAFPESVAARFGLACARIEQDATEEAVAHLEHLLAVDANHAAARFAIGRLLEKRNRIGEAIGHYSLIAGHPLLAVPARTRLGVIHSLRAEFEKALPFLESLFALGSRDDAVLFHLGLALLRTRRVAEAIARWEELQMNQAGDQRLAANLLRAYYLLGAESAAANNWEKAIEAWEKYLERVPADEKVAGDLAAIYAYRAAGLLEQRDIDHAANLLETALRHQPGHRRARYLLALCELDRKHWDASLELLTALDQEEAGEPQLRYHMAICLLRKGDGAAATPLLESLASQSEAGDYAACARMALANEHVRRGQWGAAAEALQPIG